LLGLKILYAFHYRIDSDEPQHLHVVWGWTRHLVPYRDYFDNHSPLFQLLCAPLFGALGTRADIIVPMRLAMIPFFLLSLYFVGRIVGTLFSARVGLWAAMFAAVMPRYFFVTTEFRPDDLWMVLWLAMLFVAVSGALNIGRAFVIGVLMGVSFCVSAKTLLLMVSMALGSITILILQWRIGLKTPKMRLLQLGLAIAGGTMILPVALSLFFWSRGALDQMFYCIVSHNVLPVAVVSESGLVRGLKWILFLALPIGIGIFLFPRCAGDARRTRALWIWLAAWFYYVTLKTCWPILATEDYVASDPLFMAILAVVVVSLPGLQSRSPFTVRGSPFRVHGSPSVSTGFLLASLLVLLGLGMSLRSASPFEDRTRDKISMVATTLRLTQPSDFVMDSKGETIYRKRPFYYVLEGLTGRRMKAGLIADTIPQRLVETQTPLATVRRMPRLAADFIRRNYVPIAFRLSVLGQVLAANGEKFNFEIAVPNVYSMVSEFGSFAGTLDGKDFSGPIRLEAGHHEIQRTGGSGRLAVLWARAVGKGYDPFSPVPPDVWTDQD